MKKLIPLLISSAAICGILTVYGNPSRAFAHQYGAQSGASPQPSVSPSVSATASPGTSAISEELNNTVALNIIHHTNVLEIIENETALQRLQTPGAQQIAQTFITDHQTSERQIFTTAADSNIPVYEFRESTFEGAGDTQLSSINNSDYDAAYLQLQLQGHQRALANLQMYATQTLDPALQSAVTSAITMVQTHISLITQVQSGQVPSPSPTTSVMASPSPSASASLSPSPSPTPSVSAS